MEKAILPNGIKVLYTHKKGAAVVVEVMAKVGSNDETDTERGISHFLEHLLFEGTTKRPTNKEITNEIEKIGGDFNAYTTNERTCYHIKVLQKHFPIAVEILADIVQNPLFREKDINREKNVVLKEIDMVNDEPRFYQWILFQKALYQKCHAKYPTYGDKNIIKRLTPENIRQYFQKWYYPKNMVVSIVGDVPRWKQEVTKKFILNNKIQAQHQLVAEPPAVKVIKKVEKRSTTNTYLILGFKTVPRTHEDAYALEVINGILGRGQSGRMFSEIRVKRGLAYDVGTQHVAEVNFGYFAVYATIDKKNISLVQKVIQEELDSLQQVSELDVAESKTFIEGNYLLELDEPQKLADSILFWELTGSAELLGKFIGRIKKVTTTDVQRVAQKYFKNHTLAIVEGK